MPVMALTHVTLVVMFCFWSVDIGCFVLWCECGWDYVTNTLMCVLSVWRMFGYVLQINWYLGVLSLVTSFVS